VQEAAEPDRPHQPAEPDEALAIQLEQARQTETQAYRSARDVRILTQWLSHDALALAGRPLATGKELFDFLVEELAQREPEHVRRIRPTGCGFVCQEGAKWLHAVR
jgi:hypothetical protein